MESSSLKKLASIAEIIVGVAIVITLIVLVFELQSNTIALQRTSYNEISQSLENWRYTIGTNSDARDMIIRLDNGTELSPEQNVLRSDLSRNLYSIYERAFWANEYDQMGDSEWERFERTICSSRFRFWDESSSFIHTDEFAAFVRACP